ncbi:unnamed protein product [Timema podura]|uniref:Dolichyl-diphosphooligosaccharide--protein glycosyltransferase subunit 4 n=1 Tax=Timema podura TaxID=61482 RepID=A0ABN7NNK4_TIMPD|nr:unnamed protein product [Timema podura]
MHKSKDFGEQPSGQGRAAPQSPPSRAAPANNDKLRFLSSNTASRARRRLIASVLGLKGVMITDVQLAVFANVLGVTLFLLVVLYHYISANNSK